MWPIKAKPKYVIINSFDCCVIDVETATFSLIITDFPESPFQHASDNDYHDDHNYYYNNNMLMKRFSLTQSENSERSYSRIRQEKKQGNSLWRMFRLNLFRRKMCIWICLASLVCVCVFFSNEHNEPSCQDAADWKCRQSIIMMMMMMIIGNGYISICIVRFMKVDTINFQTMMRRIERGIHHACGLYTSQQSSESANRLLNVESFDVQ